MSYQTYCACMKLSCYTEEAGLCYTQQVHRLSNQHPMSVQIWAKWQELQLKLCLLQAVWVHVNFGRPYEH